MHTASLSLDFVIPFPEALDLHLPGGLLFQFEAQNAHGSAVDGIVLPEAKCAWCLSTALQQLSNPALPTAIDPNELSAMIWQHTCEMISAKWETGDRNAAVGVNLMLVACLAPNS